MTAESIDVENSKRVARDFATLYERSKQLFNIIRELPQYGHEQWCTFFQRAFDCHTKLWRFQQQNRAILEQYYGLQRWQIGEMAHRIAQLYFLYYLRSSDTAYLYESLSFYRAIGTRKYFHKPSDGAKTEELSLKRLRYFVRYLVVCVLLRKMDLIRGIINEMQREIAYNQATFRGNMSEWRAVLEEVQRFVPCLKGVKVLQSQSEPVPPTAVRHGQPTDYHNVRMLPLLPGGDSPAALLATIGGKQLSSALAGQQQRQWRLCEAVLVGNTVDQAKCGEVSIDMYRMMLALEREPKLDPQPEPMTAKNRNALGEYNTKQKPTSEVDNSDATVTNTAEVPSQPVTSNPHKCMLYQPGYAEMHCFLAASVKALPADGVLLLYLSMDGIVEPVASSAKHSRDKANCPADPVGFSEGGLMTNPRREFELTPNQQKSTSAKEPRCIYPGDLFSFTRRPMFLVVDSDNSLAFQNFPSIFGQPLVVLLSAELCPPRFIEQRTSGNLLTHFLHNPLDALCLLCDVVEVAVPVWEQLERCLHRFLTEAYLIMLRCKTLPFSVREFMCDGFLLAYMLRFLFAGVVCRLHRDFSGERFYPRSQPDLRECTEVYHAPGLQKCVVDMAALLKSRERFATSDDLTSRE